MSTLTAEQLKDEGNALFKDKKYEEAIVKYTAGIELDGKHAILYANRAICYLSLESSVVFSLWHSCTRFFSSGSDHASLLALVDSKMRKMTRKRYFLT